MPSTCKQIENTGNGATHKHWSTNYILVACNKRTKPYWCGRLADKLIGMSTFATLEISITRAQ